MAATTEIAWTDATFNPWSGCTKVAPGCTHCYAEADAKRWNRSQWGPNGTRVKTSESNWAQPLKWNRDAENCRRMNAKHFPGLVHQRPRVFCASLADVFEDWDGPIYDHKGQRLLIGPAGDLCTSDIEGLIPTGWRNATMADLRRDLFALIDATPDLDWLLLTKRPENIRRMWPEKHDAWPVFPGMPGPLGKPVPCIVKGAHRANVWLGTSFSEQATLDRNWNSLVDAGALAPILFLSGEPLLGPADLWQACRNGPAPDWLIVGGESGPGARPCNIEWLRSLRDQCKAAGVPCFVKQLGSNCVVDRNDEIGGGIHCLLKHKHRDKKGGEINEFPEDLRIREFPELEVSRG